MTSPLHSIARRGTVIVASLATAALALSVSPAVAADPTGIISGTLTSADGGVTTGEVQAFVLSGTDWEPDAHAFTDGDGYYEFPALVAGDYRLMFTEDVTQFNEYWADADSLDTANTIELAPGADEIADESMDDEQVQDYLFNEVEPTITGTAQVGSTLTANPGEWTPSDAEITFSYQWSNDQGDIAGATGETYSLTAAEDGEWMQVQITASATGFGDEVAYGYLDEIVTTPTVHAVADPTVSGTPQVGSPLTANPGTWDRSDATFTFSWETYKEGQQHTDFLAHGKTYVPTAAIVGQRVWVTVYASAPGVGDGYASSALVGPVTAAPVVTPPVVVPPVVVPPVVTPPVTDVDDTQKPKVQGAKKVGSTLKAKVASWIPAGATVKYQWLVNGKVIKKATKAKLKVTKKLKGKKVSVRVIATSAGSLPVAVVTKVGKIK